MGLTPSEIEKKTFSTALRGYDLNEVDDFLDEVVATIRDLQDQLAESKTGAKAPAQAVDESAVGRVLVTAQQTADSIVADARTEAERIVADARTEADTWSAERDKKKSEADAEMAELSAHVGNVRTHLAVLVTALADRLDEMDATIAGVEVGPIESGGPEVLDLGEAETDDAWEVPAGESETPSEALIEQDDAMEQEPIG